MAKTKSFIWPLYIRQGRIEVWCGERFILVLFCFHFFLWVKWKFSFANKRGGKVCVTAHSTSIRSAFKTVQLPHYSFHNFSVVFHCSVFISNRAWNSFHLALVVKEPTCRCRRCKIWGFDPWVGMIPWRRAWQPTPVFLPGEVHGQRSLAGTSPWGGKDSDTTEAT